MSRATDTGTGRLLPPVYLCLLNWLFASKTSLIGHRSVVQPAGVLLKLNRNFLCRKTNTNLRLLPVRYHCADRYRQFTFAGWIGCLLAKPLCWSVVHPRWCTTETQPNFLCRGTNTNVRLLLFARLQSIGQVLEAMNAEATQTKAVNEVGAGIGVTDTSASCLGKPFGGDRGGTSASCLACPNSDHGESERSAGTRAGGTTAGVAKRALCVPAVDAQDARLVTEAIEQMRAAAQAGGARAGPRAPAQPVGGERGGTSAPCLACPTSGQGLSGSRRDL